MDITHDQRLALDEARRARQHGNLRTELEAEVDRRVAAEARGAMAAEPRIEEVAANLRHKAVAEVETSERELETLRVAARLNQVIDYVFYLLYGLLGLRFVLALMAANNSAGFVRFVKGVTDPFYLPFKGIVASPSAESGATLALPILLAIVVYFLLHLAIRGLLRVIAARRTHL